MYIKSVTDIVLGPLINTIDDFWWMVWNEKCDKIVMLTNLFEDEKVKYFTNLLDYLIFFLKCKLVSTLLIESNVFRN